MKTQSTPILGFAPGWREANEERFWSLVDRRAPSECWPWTAARDRDGYGMFHIRRHDGKASTARASKIVTMLVHGDPPFAFAHSRHACDNPPCCNPAHMSWGSAFANTMDAVRRQRTSAYRRMCRSVERKHSLWATEGILSPPRIETLPASAIRAADRHRGKPAWVKEAEVADSEARVHAYALRAESLGATGYISPTRDRDILAPCSLWNDAEPIDVRCKARRSVAPGESRSRAFNSETGWGLRWLRDGRLNPKHKAIVRSAHVNMLALAPLDHIPLLCQMKEIA